MPSSLSGQCCLALFLLKRSQVNQQYSWTNAETLLKKSPQHDNGLNHLGTVPWSRHQSHRSQWILNHGYYCTLMWLVHGSWLLRRKYNPLQEIYLLALKFAKATNEHNHCLDWRKSSLRFQQGSEWQIKNLWIREAEGRRGQDAAQKRSRPSWLAWCGRCKSQRKHIADELSYGFHERTQPSMWLDRHKVSQPFRRGNLPGCQKLCGRPLTENHLQRFSPLTLRLLDVW